MPSTTGSTRRFASANGLIGNVADVLAENKHEYAELMTAEMGKPVSQAIGEIEKCVWGCEHYAQHAHTYLQDDHHASPAGTNVKTQYDPLGTVLAVMPWNFPFWQVIRFAAPYLTAGNVGILKHAPEVPGCAHALEDLFSKAGYPDGVVQSLLVDPDAIHEQILPDDSVRAATLTGSSRAGRAVAETVGKHRKKTVLELGGSDPFVVLDDAAVEAAAETAVWARMQNGGQSCIAAKRILVDESVYGAFYEPTVLTDVPEGCPADTEELFGPAAILHRVSDVDDAIRLANDTDFGLGASVWTEDRARGQRVADRIDAGCVYINEMTKSDPRVPFGGVKDSGYGRELSGAGMREFVNAKTVWIE